MQCASVTGMLAKLREDVATAFVDETKNAHIASKLSRLESGFVTSAKLLAVPESDSLDTMLSKVSLTPSPAP